MSFVRLDNCGKRNWQPVLVLYLGCLLVWGLSPQVLLGQPVGELPSKRYYAARELYRMGNIHDAAEGFREVLSLAQRSTSDGWIDSIPARVMLAECHLQHGELAKALDLYDAALMTMLKFPDWLGQFSLSEQAVPLSEAALKGVNWFRPSQQSTSISLPAALQLQIDPTKAKQDAQGNLLAPISVAGRLDSTEVLRTVGIALVRRWQLLGPLAKHSPLTNPLVQYFANNTSATAVWAQSSWMSLESLAKLPQDPELAAASLTSSAFLNNRQFDYFLTPLILQVLGEIQAGKGQYQAAIVLFQDAALLSAQHQQLDQLAESLSWLGDCAAVNGRTDLIDPILAATNWCNKRASRAQVAGMTAVIELAMLADRLQQAKKLMVQQANLLKTSKSVLPRVAARALFAESQMAFLENQIPLGWTKLNESLQTMQGSAASGPIPASIFQKQLTLDLLFAGNLTQQQGQAILAELVAEPTSLHWELMPLETMAAQLISATPVCERWLAMVEPTESSEVITRMDLLQRRKLFEAMRLGGRLFCWNQAIMKPVGELPPDIRAQVQAMKQTVPILERLPKQLEDAVDHVRSLPMQIDEKQISNEHRQIFLQMEDLAAQLESQLLALSLSRKPLRRYVPESINIEQTQKRLKPGEVLLGFAEAGEELRAVAISSTKTASWLVDTPSQLLPKLTLLYGDLGFAKSSVGRSPQLTLDPSAKWRANASELYEKLIGSSPDGLEMVRKAQKLIIAPSGWVWYVPFELLSETGRAPLISSTDVSYVPTLGSYPKVSQGSNANSQALLFAGSYFSKNKSTNAIEVKKVAEEVQPTIPINLDQQSSLTRSNWLKVQASEIVLLDAAALRFNETGILPIPTDSKNAVRLTDWVGATLPSPNMLWLAAYESRIPQLQLGDGSDIFIPAATIYLTSGHGVLTRWSVGGESGSRFLQRARSEFRQTKVPSMSSRRATISLWSEKFLVGSELVLKTNADFESQLISGQHPLFWAGYMSIGD